MSISPSIQLTRKLGEAEVKLSVVICTYNPIETIFSKVLQSLCLQTLPQHRWELIVVDNNSNNPVKDSFDLSWHKEHKNVVEQRAGLSHARLAGVTAAQYPLIVFVDDDNMLQKDYLQHALDFYETHPEVGCFGGKSLPQFETNPPSWFYETEINLGCRSLEIPLKISDFKSSQFNVTTYPNYAPIGTGMVIRKDAFLCYVNEVRNSVERLALGRKGKSLISGEDNDIILTIIKHGFEVAYVPDLIVYHLIPKQRYEKKYLVKMAYESNWSWIKVLALHNIYPWSSIPRASIMFRQLRAYFRLKGWQSTANYIRWKGACGKLKALSEI